MSIPESFTDEERKHILRLRDKFESTYGLAEGDELVYVRAPGRTEIAGNHTDHEGGHVIGGAVDCYVRGIFSPNNSYKIRLLSEGHSSYDLDLSDLAVHPERFNESSEMLRGMAATFAERGFLPNGFDVYLASDIPSGSGVSSSAAFELALASAMNLLWAKGVLAPEDLAIMSQEAENKWFGKPCGLLDQASSALGGIQFMDFSKPGSLEAEALDFDFEEAGYSIVLVQVGADHAALTSEYAAIPEEMQAGARELGAERLGDIPELKFVVRYAEMRRKLGDRPVIRAHHYYREESLCVERAEALRKGDIERFMALMRLSGASSAMFLQNVSVNGAKEQPAMVALALADHLLHERGAVRIHGGGFGGTIQAFVPHDLLDDFLTHMENAMGKGSSAVYNIDHVGARAWRI